MYIKDLSLDFENSIQVLTIIYTRMVDAPYLFTGFKDGTVVGFRLLQERSLEFGMR